MILLDEFNLASPEYYFTQLMQKLPLADAERKIRLFDRAGKPIEQHAPDEIRLHRNVSVWGTINHDETTERLSTRLLDRTGTIFLSSRDVAPSVLDSDSLNIERPGAVKATQLFDVFRRPP